MGCCCSKEDSSSYQDGEPNERTRLIPDIRENTSIASSGDFDGQYDCPRNEKTDEYSSHSRILNRTAGKLIDVAAPDCQMLEEHESAEREKMYTQKIYKISAPLGLVKQYTLSSLLMDIPAVDKVLSSEPIQPNDFFMMHDACAKMFEAVLAMKVHCDEPVLVPFGEA